MSQAIEIKHDYVKWDICVHTYVKLCMTAYDQYSIAHSQGFSANGVLTDRFGVGVNEMTSLNERWFHCFRTEQMGQHPHSELTNIIKEKTPFQS